MARPDQMCIQTSVFLKELTASFCEKSGEPLSSFVERALLLTMRLEKPDLYSQTLDECLRLVELKNRQLISMENKMSILMRLSMSPTNDGKGANAFETIDFYKNHANTPGNDGCVLFSTDVLYKGIGVEKQKKIKELIQKGDYPKIYFIASKQGGGENQIFCSAKILGFESNSTPTLTKDSALEPVPFRGMPANVFLKLAEFCDENILTPRDFLIESTNEEASKSFEGQAAFFYCRLRY